MFKFIYISVCVPMSSIATHFNGTENEAQRSTFKKEEIHTTLHSHIYTIITVKQQQQQQQTTMKTNKMQRKE